MDFRPSATYSAEPPNKRASGFRPDRFSHCRHGRLTHRFRVGVQWITNGDLRTLSKDGETRTLGRMSDLVTDQQLVQSQGQSLDLSDLTGMALAPSREGQDGPLIFLADQGIHVIWVLDGKGGMHIHAGVPGQPGKQDGAGGQAQFRCPAGLAVDAGGALWVCDKRNLAIRKIAKDGTVSTVIGHGRTGEPGCDFMHWPHSIIPDLNTASMLVANGEAIHRITPDGTCTPVAGQAGVEGLVDWPAGSPRSEEGCLGGGRACFSGIRSMALRGDELWVVDGQSQAVRILDLATGGLATVLRRKDGTVRFSPLPGVPGIPAQGAAQIVGPSVIAFSASGQCLLAMRHCVAELILPAATAGPDGGVVAETQETKRPPATATAFD